MSNVCIHLAVSLLDFFMDNHDLKFDTIMLVSFACLTLAGKCDNYYYGILQFLHLYLYIYICINLFDSKS